MENIRQDKTEKILLPKMMLSMSNIKLPPWCIFTEKYPDVPAAGF